MDKLEKQNCSELKLLQEIDTTRLELEQASRRRDFALANSLHIRLKSLYSAIGAQNILIIIDRIAKVQQKKISYK